MYQSNTIHVTMSFIAVNTECGHPVTPALGLHACELQLLLAASLCRPCGGSSSQAILRYNTIREKH